MLKDTQIEKLVLPKLREVLGPFGFTSAHAESGQDHDGDPVVFLYAAYVEKAPELDPRAAIDASLAVMDLLHKKGDERFVHMRHLYPDEEAAIDEDEPGSLQ